MKKKTPSQPSRCDVLAFGAHPDDLELTIGGTLHKLARAGYRAVAIDLTRGESGTRGNAARRRREAMRAASLLGLAYRENLNLGDASLEFSLSQRRAVASAIRRHRPEIILAPWVEDLHPDHAAAGQIVQAAFYEARLAKLAEGEEPWFTRFILFYPGRHYHHPTVIVDVSAEYPVKTKAILAYRSQTERPGKNSFRPPGFPDPFSTVELRDRHFGSLIGTSHGEGFIATSPIPLTSLAALLFKPNLEQ